MTASGSASFLSSRLPAMWTGLVSSLLVSVVATAPTIEPRTGATGYEGYKVLRMETGGQLEKVKELLSAFQYDEWTHDASEYIDFSISADQAKKLKELGASFSEIHSDLGKDIVDESKPCDYKGKNKTGDLPDLSWFDGYHAFDDHLDYLDDLADAFPNSETFVSGESLEGRPQKGIHFWGKSGKGKNQAILWHGTTHAREWISAMTVEYLAYKLIEGYGKDDLVSSFLNDYDFYLIPFVNPDGFVYTQTQDRLWRKNRQPPLPRANQSHACWGVDLNRNWPHEWDTNSEGSSNNSCTQTYRGEYPGSEPEMAGMAGFADKLAENQGIKLFIDWHSYSQLLLTPYGYSCEDFPETNDEHIALMEATAEAIFSVHGTNYTAGPGCETLYPTNGASYDYAYDVNGAEWSSLIELRDTGDYGFILPPEQILPNCEEIWAGMQVMLARL